MRMYKCMNALSMKDELKKKLHLHLFIMSAIFYEN